MKQKITFKLFLAVMLMAFCGTGAWAQLWTKAESIAVGDEVLLVYEADKLELLDFSKTKYGSIKSYTNAPQGLYPLTVVVGANGENLAFKHDDGKGNVVYLNWHGKNNLYQENALDAAASWKVSIDAETGNAAIRNVKDSTRVIQFGNGDRFACYQSTQKDIQIYKKTGDSSKLTQTLSFGNTEEFTVVQGEAFTAPTLSGAYTAVTYESSKVEVATVDPSTGAVTLTGALGTTVITATAAADSKYNAASASYTLNVKAAPNYVANIADFLAKAVVKTEYTFQNPVVVVKQQGSDLWIKDETGYLNVHGNVGQTYNMGDEIPAGFSGFLNVFKEVTQLNDVTGFLPASKTGLVVEPVEKAIDGITKADINAYVVVKNVTVASDKKSIADGAKKLATYEKFGTAEYPATGDQNRYDVIGIVNHYNSLQLLPMEIVLHKNENLKDQTLKFAQDKYTALLSDKTFQAELTGAMTTVTYVSSNPKVATVDANGVVTLVGVGTAIITANAAADAAYNAATAEYELSVETAGAVLPFAFSGTYSNLDPNFVEANIASKYYSGKANLRFDQTGHALTLKLDQEYENIELGYFIKLNGIPKAGNAYTVSVSTDNVNFVPVKAYGEELDGTELAEALIVAGPARYIRWEYTNKASGNVGMGNISVKVAPTSYALNITAAGYATFAAKQAYTLPAGLQGGIVTVVGNEATVDYIYAENSVVPAEEALLIKGAEGSYTLNVASATAEKSQKNQLKGAFTDGEIKAAAGSEVFVFAEGSKGLGFYWQQGRTDGKAVKAINGKAYLELTQATANAQGFRLVEGEATGIEGVEAQTEVGAIYTLAGVRVNAAKGNLPKGLYIINGKKVLVK